MTFAVEIAALN